MAAQILERTAQRFSTGSMDRNEFNRICLCLSSYIDRSLQVEESPHSPPKELLHLLNKIIQHKDDESVRPAVVALLLSFKAAFRAGWFSLDESAELLTIANDVLADYNPVSSTASSEGLTKNFLSGILSKFYPWLKLDKILLWLDLKPEFHSMVSDFRISRQSEQVRLFIIKKNSPTSSCLVVPTASFLINGHGVEKRTCNMTDVGPQPPADCTSLIKKGNNILQIVGDFQAPYLIAIAITIPVPLNIGPSDLPEAQALHSRIVDEELTEGSSRVSLRCPISRKRIVNPVKGTSCRHLQCFDFKTYLDINFRRPSWRCPYCNLDVSCSDLRLDSKMAEILAKVDDEVMDIVLANDGSWEVLVKLSAAAVENEKVIDICDEENDASGFEQSHRRSFSFHSSSSGPSFADVFAASAEDVKPDVSRLAPANNITLAEYFLSITAPLQTIPLGIDHNSEVHDPRYWQHR